MRLIDADALKEVLCLDDLIQLKAGIDGRIIDKLIDSTPTVNAVPVVHGYWKVNEVAFYQTCSECGAMVRSNLDEVFLGDYSLNYCPNCGAKMDGERREDDG